MGLTFGTITRQTRDPPSDPFSTSVLAKIHIEYNSDVYILNEKLCFKCAAELFTAFRCAFIHIVPPLPVSTLWARLIAQA